MTKPIKFRVLIKPTRQMIYKLDYIPTESACIRIYDNYYLPEDYEIMQFIGQQDLYEKEIYEGDIVKSWLQGKELDFEIDIITDIRKSIILKSGHSFDNSWLLFEVIGNIYEHPHLLEKK